MTDYLVLGAGAIGGSLAHHLALTGHRVTVVDADRDHVSAIRDRGIVLVDPLTGDESTAVVHAACMPAQAETIGPLPSRVILATKSHHVVEAAAWLARILPSDGDVLLTQNGDSLAAAAPFLGERAFSAFINFAADVVGPGRIRVGGPGGMAIGERSGEITPRVEGYVHDLRAFGDVTASSNVAGLIWAKRGIGSMFAAASLADEYFPDLIDDYRDVLSAVVTEIFAIATDRGIELEDFDGIAVRDLVDSAIPSARAAAFAQLLSFTRSMPGKARTGVFRDIAVRGRPTEARPELRTLISTGAERGITTSALEQLDAVLGELESGERTFGRHNYQDFTAHQRGI